MLTTVDAFVSHNGDNLWDFEVISDIPYENVNRIHPLKQRDVALLIQDDFEWNCYYSIFKKQL